MKLGRLKRFVFFGGPDYELHTTDDNGLVSVRPLAPPTCRVFFRDSINNRPPPNGFVLIELHFRGEQIEMLVGAIDFHLTVHRIPTVSGVYTISHQLDLELYQDNLFNIQRFFDIYTSINEAIFRPNGDSNKFEMRVTTMDSHGDPLTRVYLSECWIASIGYEELINDGDVRCKIKIIPNQVTHLIENVNI